MLVTIGGEKGTSIGPFHPSPEMKALNNEKRRKPPYTVFEYLYILLFGPSLTHFISKIFAKKCKYADESKTLISASLTYYSRKLQRRRILNNIWLK